MTTTATVKKSKGKDWYAARRTIAIRKQTCAGLDRIARKHNASLVNVIDALAAGWALLTDEQKSQAFAEKHRAN